jgi:2'-5' RNA ligase
LKRTGIAYWLVPAEPAQSFFERTIVDLARRYRSPVFDPHVTVHVGPDRAGFVDQLISQAASGCEPVRLEVLEVRHSGEFTKTLFVQFALNAKLRQLNETIRTAAQDPSDYQLKPHLSLLYKKMPILARRQLADSITVPFSEVFFDLIRAVRCALPTRNRADVEAWRVLATKPLGK